MTFIRYKRRAKTFPGVYGFLILLGAFFFTLYIVLSPKRKILPHYAPVEPIVQPVRSDDFDPFFENLISQDFERIVPTFGEFGEPAYLDEINVTSDGVRARRTRFGLNVDVSDRIPYNRTLPETRPRPCRDKKYSLDLPKASIIIISHNEPWSPLIRTVISILNRTNHHYIEEIIIVDDGSEYPEYDYDFHDKLNYFIQTRLPDFVWLLRSSKRLGVVGARLKGAHAAKGEILVFLDAHIEVNDLWLPPLLDRLKSNRHFVVQPVVDHIHWDHFEYTPFNSAHHFPVGTFTWSGSFEWLDMDFQTIRTRDADQSKPLLNPIMAGGIFAIDRRFFWQSGSYDEGMRGWGSENIEMSLRIWTCGGRIEIVPCSVIGHVFRTRSPIDPFTNKSIHTQEDYSYNLLRTVKVWWDDYERLLFNNRPALRHVDFGDVTDRLELRKRLGCKPMNWFVTSVLPKYDMDRDSRFSGRLQSDAGDCLTFRGHLESRHGLALMRPCAKQLQQTQYFAFSHAKELRREYLCAMPHIDIPESTYHVRMRPCADSSYSTWKYIKEDRTLMHIRLIRCLDSDDDHATLAECDPKKRSQRWTFIDNATLNY